jgi:transcription termination factor Rho
MNDRDDRQGRLAPNRRRRRRKRGGGGGPHGGGGRPRGGRGPSRDYNRIPEGEAAARAHGVLQVGERGHGYLRSVENSYNADPADPVVPRELVEQWSLETGLELEGPAVEGRPPVMQKLDSINRRPCEAWADRRPFKDLVAEDPVDRIRMEVEGDEISTRVIDLIAPIGKGQRCLVVAPPKAGKTVLLQKIAHSITTNHPEIHLIVLLVDERPEEVTDMRRNVRGEVVASSSDEMARNHVQVAEIVLERAKRLVEQGGDVVVLLDSITRLSRAYNAEQKSSGRVLSGGIDARTMEKPRRFFGAARNAEGGGSLTVIGTALIDTGSRMDEVIFQEFKGTGNTEIVLDRKLAERRIFPAIDIAQSGTRKEEKLFDADELEGVHLLRRALASREGPDTMRLLIERISRFPSNAEFLRSLKAAV